MRWLARPLSLTLPVSPHVSPYLLRSLCSHRPAPGLDALEQLSWDTTDTLEALKLESFTGFYNLAMMVLLFATSYIIIRNIKEKGLLVKAEDFTCPEMHRDAAWGAQAAGLATLVSFSSFFLMKAWKHRLITWTTVGWLYALSQAAMLFAACIFCYATPIGPIASAGVLLTVSVLMLKAHSYIATNYAMAQEQEARYGRHGHGHGTAPAPAPAPAAAAAAPAASEGSGLAAPSASTLRKRRQRRGKRGSRAAGEHAGGGAGEDDSAAEGGDGEGEEEEAAASAASNGDAPAPASTSSLPPPPAAAGHGAAAASNTHIISGSAAEKGRLIKAFPANVTLRDFCFFLAAPTLVYEPKYPRTTRIRWSYVLTKASQAAACVAFQYFMMRQFMLPVLMEPTKPSSPSPLASLGCLLFDTMKLALPSLAVWLSGFYAVFHCLLNINAEILRFADRNFFSHWWNATKIDEFWRLWNMPVHRWCARHVFLETQLYAHLHRKPAMFATFFFSAVMHELIFSVSFKTFRPWFFLGMLLQIPLMSMGKGLHSRRRGNYLMWLSLFTGQPCLELLYFREMFASHPDANLFCWKST